MLLKTLDLADRGLNQVLLCVTTERVGSRSHLTRLQVPAVAKNNGVRVAYNRNKLRNSIATPLHKRGVPTTLVDAAVTHIETALMAQPNKEVPSKWLGSLVMAEPKKLDNMAYIRFTSVYKSFKDAEDFTDAVRELG